MAPRAKKTLGHRPKHSAEASKPRSGLYLRVIFNIEGVFDQAMAGLIDHAVPLDYLNTWYALSGNYVFTCFLSASQTPVQGHGQILQERAFGKYFLYDQLQYFDEGIRLLEIYDILCWKYINCIVIYIS